MDISSQEEIDNTTIYTIQDFIDEKVLTEMDEKFIQFFDLYSYIHNPDNQGSMFFEVEREGEWVSEIEFFSMNKEKFFSEDYYLWYGDAKFKNRKDFFEQDDKTKWRIVVKYDD